MKLRTRTEQSVVSAEGQANPQFYLHACAETQHKDNPYRCLNISETFPPQDNCNKNYPSVQNRLFGTNAFGLHE